MQQPLVEKNIYIISQHSKKYVVIYHNVINTLKHVIKSRYCLLNIKYFCQNIMHVFIMLLFFSDISTRCHKVCSKICGLLLQMSVHHFAKTLHFLYHDYRVISNAHMYPHVCCTLSWCI